MAGEVGAGCRGEEDGDEGSHAGPPLPPWAGTQTPAGCSCRVGERAQALTGGAGTEARGFHAGKMQPSGLRQLLGPQ